jgi:hypothetical protein
MFLATLILTLAPAPSAPPAAAQNRREEVALRYRELHAAGDAAGLGELWKVNVGLVLPTIDADLEGSLALWESSPEAPPEAEILALQARALFGAAAATRALDEPIFLDYASSFVGWHDDQKHAFRAGQQVYARAVQEFEDENFEVAVEAGRETVERALALGDWWGAAMGYGAQADAQRALGWFEDALVAYSLARQINRALGLQHSEYKNLQGMLAVARALERPLRAHAAAEAVLAYARAFGDAAAILSTLETKAALERALGRTEAAARTGAELEALKQG